MIGLEDKKQLPGQLSPFARSGSSRHSSTHLRTLLKFRVIPRQNGACDPVLKSCRILLNLVLRALNRSILESCPCYAVLLRIGTHSIRSDLLLVRPRTPGEGLQRVLSAPPLDKDVVGRA